MADNTDLVKTFLTMQDLSAQEQQLAQQQALADQLRTGSLATPSGKDWGSQGAKALQGIAALLSGMRARKAQDAFTQSKQATLDKIINSIGGGSGSADSGGDYGTGAGGMFDQDPDTPFM